MGRRLSAETQTYTGEVVSFMDRTGEGNISSLTVPFSPIQSLHGYSHPWPGGGGKNRAHGVSYINATSRYQRVIGASYTLSAGKRYIFSFMTENTGKTVYRQTPSSIGLISASAYAFVCDGNRKSFYGTASEDVTKDDISVILKADNDNDPVGLCYNFMIEEVGDTVTTPSEYSPYSNICPISGRTGLSVYVSPTQDQQDATTYAVDWTTQAGTVYGGTLNVVTGELTVDRAVCTENDFTMVSSGMSAGGLHWADFNTTNVTVNGTSICSILGIRADGNAGWASTVPCYALTEGVRVRVYCEEGTLADFKSKYAGLQICYPLATPITYQLTPQEVRTLVGKNNIWAETGEEITVHVSMPLIGFQGWLVKVGNEGSDVEIPLKWIRAETYSATPDQRMEWSAERDVTGYLWRQTVQNQPPKIEFNTRLLTNNEISALNAIFKAAFTNEQQRKLPVQFYDMEKDEYWIWDCYMPDTKYTIRNVDTANKIVNYEETRYAFIGY